MRYGFRCPCHGVQIFDTVAERDAQAITYQCRLELFRVTPDPADTPRRRRRMSDRELIDAETGRYTCCGTDGLRADPFHAAGCPNGRKPNTQMRAIVAINANCGCPVYPGDLPLLWRCEHGNLMCGLKDGHSQPVIAYKDADGNIVRIEDNHEDQ